VFTYGGNRRSIREKLDSALAFLNAISDTVDAFGETIGHSPEIRIITDL